VEAASKHAYWASNVQLSFDYKALVRCHKLSEVGVVIVFDVIRRSLSKNDIVCSRCKGKQEALITLVMAEYIE
jgi:hypothetical protein